MRPEPRAVRQPGPALEPRAIVVPVSTVSVDAMLPAGALLLEALSGLLVRHGAESACLTLSGGALGPMAYVIPALSPDGSQAAFYSDTRRPHEPVQLESAAVTVGLRDGAVFFHCHALWTSADGVRGCGHLLPEETRIAQPLQARGVALFGARFEVAPDAETGFRLFRPVATSAGLSFDASGTQAVAVRLAPNQDLVESLEAVGRGAGFQRAVVCGGVASIIGARFSDTAPIDGFATELLVRHGALRCHDAAGPASVLDIAIIDLHGTIGCGRLVPGENPVLMTFEGVLLAA